MKSHRLDDPAVPRSSSPPLVLSPKTSRRIGRIIHQLRTYEIFEHNAPSFHARFRNHALRIMKRCGFSVPACWEAPGPGRIEFIYLLEWPDEEAMRAGWAALRSDQEWTEIKRVTATEHGDLVGEIDEKVLVPTPYSPSLTG